MNRNPKGQFKKELLDPVLMSFYVEYADRSFLREQALKRKIKISDILRNLITHFKNAKED